MIINGFPARKMGVSPSSLDGLLDWENPNPKFSEVLTGAPSPCVILYTSDFLVQNI